MRWGPAAIFPSVIFLIGLVMVMGGRGGTKVAQQIGLVILGCLVLAALFALVVNRTL